MPVLALLKLLVDGDKPELCIAGDESVPKVETEAEVDPLLVLQLKVDMLKLKIRLDVLQLELGTDREVNDSEGRLMLPVPKSEVFTDDAGTVMVVVYEPE